METAYYLGIYLNEKTKAERKNEEEKVYNITNKKRKAEDRDRHIKS